MQAYFQQNTAVMPKAQQVQTEQPSGCDYCQNARHIQFGDELAHLCPKCLHSKWEARELTEEKRNEAVDVLEDTINSASWPNQGKAALSALLELFTLIRKGEADV